MLYVELPSRAEAQTYACDEGYVLMYGPETNQCFRLGCVFPGQERGSAPICQPRMMEVGISISVLVLSLLIVSLVLRRTLARDAH